MTIRTCVLTIAMGLTALGASGTSQTVRTSRVMKDKLSHAQRILEALTTSDYRLLASEATSLARIVDSPEWDELKTEEFRGYTDAFTTATGRLVDASSRRDLDAAAKAYEPLVASCYSCHRYRKMSRIAEPVPR